MALEYTLKVEEDFSSSQLLKLVFEMGHMQSDGDSLSGPGLVFVSAFTESSLGKSIIRDGFNFTPSKFLLFRLDKFDKTDQGVIYILRSTINILRHSSGDAILLFNGEDVVLARLSGRLILNDGWGFWNPKRLAEVTLEYKIENIPSI